MITISNKSPVSEFNLCGINLLNIGKSELEYNRPEGSKRVWGRTSLRMNLVRFLEGKVLVLEGRKVLVLLLQV